ncbi:hypothetical protein NQZ68_033754 [Dissostichus eleginoides]|nr:hypothetical protein NQZ68_033754 [Dissostichus eleginoides]
MDHGSEDHVGAKETSLINKAITQSGLYTFVPVVRQSGGIPCGYHRRPPGLPDFLHDCSAAAQMGPLGSQTLKRSMVAKPSRNNC